MMDDYPRPTIVVGGTNDGCLCHVKHFRRVRLPVKHNLSEALAHISEPTQVDRFSEEYRAFDHGIGDRKFSVWVPAGWDDDRAAKEIFGRIADIWESWLNKHANLPGINLA